MRTALALALAAVALGGCEKLMRNMYDDARARPLRPVAGSPAAHVPEGAVERVGGVIAGTSSGRAGVGAQDRLLAAEDAPAMPYRVTLPLLGRGRERFEIYCAPCHGVLGDGDGIVARRGFPHPPSYHLARLKEAPDRRLYDVITNGYGIMYAYADRVAPDDRWAIVAYIRALQLSQDAPTVVSARKPSR